MEVFWLVCVICFLVFEAMTTNLVTIWFAVASFCSLICSYFTDNIFIQIIVFAIVSLLTLIFTKPILDKLFKDKKVKTNVDMLIGKIGIVTEDITELKKGRVKVDSKDWMATSKENINKGTKVEVLKIEGAKLIVKPKED